MGRPPGIPSKRNARAATSKSGAPRRGPARHGQVDPAKVIEELQRLGLPSQRKGAKKGPASGGGARPGSPSRPPRPEAKEAAVALEAMSSPRTVADAAVEVAEAVERVVVEDGRRSERAMASAMSRLGRLTWADKAWIKQAQMSLFRWHGWVRHLDLERVEARLLVSVLLDHSEVPEVARLWAKAVGVNPTRLFGLAGAPDWAARAEGLRRLFDNRRLTTDPWLLFPAWIKDALPLPPGNDAPKHRLVAFLQQLQKRPALWLRARTAEPGKTWSSLKEAGLAPWVLRGFDGAARLPEEVDLASLAIFRRGDFVVQDLASQMVGLACDPEPGERWWVTCAGSGDKALQLADRMNGQGAVVVTDLTPQGSKAAALKLKKFGRGNLAVRDWDGKHTPGKSGSYQGVLVDPPSSGIGTWRRHPDARWSVDGDAVARLAAQQSSLLDIASRAVKTGGNVVYTVRTVTKPETEAVVEKFLADHPNFEPDPMPAMPGDDDKATDHDARIIWPEPFDNDAVFVARFVRVK